MPRILHVLDHGLPLHSGYAFRTRAIMKAQEECGWDVAGVTGVRQREFEAEQPAEETVDGLRFHRTRDVVTGPSPLREWREIGALAERIEEIAAAWRPDIVHAHSPVLSGAAGLRAAQRLGLPLVYEIRAFWEDAAVGNGSGGEGTPRYWLTRALESHVVRQADAVAVICHGLERDLVRRGIAASKIAVVPNGVDMSVFGEPIERDRALAEKLGLAGKKVVGFIGSFYDYEGLDDLIGAMPWLCARVPGAHLLLVGGGPKEAELRARAKASPAAEAIHFVGRVPHREVERYYALIDILAYPRKSMRLTELVTPLKPLEAMAQGRLVAASDVGGHRELIEDGVTGTLFAADDPRAIATALARMFAARGQWDERRAAARAYVERERDWARLVQRYEPVYHLLLGKKPFGQAA